MVRVGVRELRQRASALLRQVEQGETIEITDRGRPVAILGPIPEVGALERLRRSGEVRPADADLGDFPDPLPLPRMGDRAPSDALAELRDHER